VKGIY